MIGLSSGPRANGSRRPSRRAVTVVGAAATIVGGIVVVIYLFQPWRSCEYEDTAMGCAMLPVDGTVMFIAGLVTLAGMVTMAAAGTAQVWRMPREEDLRRRG